MGTATFDIVKYSKNGSRNVSGELVTSGAHTTSTTASNLTDGAAGAGSAVTGRVGDVLFIKGDEDMRISVGGTAATASSGYYLPANESRYIEITTGGNISIIDVA